MICLLFMIVNSGILINNIYRSLAIMGLSDNLRYLFYLLFHFLLCLLIITSNCSTNYGRIWYTVVCEAAFNVADWKYYVFSVIYLPWLDCMKRIQNCSSCSYWVMTFVRLWSVTTLAFNVYVDHGRTSKKASWTYSYISFVEIWNVMKTINFINSIQAAIFNHRESTSRAFFSWLKNKSYKLFFWNEMPVIMENLGSCQKSNHMSIMATHMSKVSFCSVIQSRVVFRYWQTVHICSQSDRI